MEELKRVAFKPVLSVDKGITMEKPEAHLLHVDTKSLGIDERERILLKLSKYIKSGQVRFHSNMKDNLISELAEISFDSLDKVKVRPLCLAAIVDRKKFKPGEVFFLTKVTNNGVYGIYGKVKNDERM